ncbi:hypothetical protein [Bacteroides hominis]|uniref:hypothetical protein n=1 Tax=Bacteroides hominis TaxID=2763023 RepID=UPI003D6ACE71
MKRRRHFIQKTEEFSENAYVFSMKPLYVFSNAMDYFGFRALQVVFSVWLIVPEVALGNSERYVVSFLWECYGGVTVNWLPI